MTDVQIDMYEVQLGAAILLQARDSLGTAVRILADGGIKQRSGYQLDHVARKLLACFAAFAPDEPRIDLMVGTHYDEDHLAGLPDVIKAIPIGEAMLPPVRSSSVTAGMAAIKRALMAERRVTRLTEDSFSDEGFLTDFSPEQWDRYFELLGLIDSAASARIDQLSPGYRPEVEVDDDETIDLSTDHVTTDGWYLPIEPLSVPNPTALVQLAAIRNGVRKGSITAKWLREVAKELKVKNVPIRNRTIQKGVPEYYVWDTVLRVFTPSSQTTYNGSGEPKFTLLGPSRSLVSRHSRRLPLVAYLSIGGRLIVKSITASNQLSYVLLFEAGGQQILIAGDAGCVDFQQKSSRQLFPQLLSAMKNPSVIQVAHHAGSNARFYQALLDGPFAPPKNHSLLLISHAYHDGLRPTAAFSSFVNTLTSRNAGVQLLFTSEPLLAAVAAFGTLIHHVVGSHNPVGDVRLTSQSGIWRVNSHSVRP